MRLRRAAVTAALGLAAVTGPAWAQAPQGAGQQPPPCIQKFLELRTAAETKAKAIEAAGKRKQKPSAQEACGLFNTFSAAEAKLIKYASENQTWCGIPAQIVEQMKTAHKRTREARSRICRVAAAGPARPRGPTLSDALGASVPDSNNVKTGHGGTFDTLTGSALGNR